MALYICHQCASARALRRGLLRIIPVKTSESLFLPALVPTPRLLTTSRSRPDQISKASKEPSATPPTQPIKGPLSIANAATPSSNLNAAPATATTVTGVTGITGVTEAPSDPVRIEHIEATRRRIDQLSRQLEVDALYLEFWRICCTETIQDQRLIWYHESVYPKDIRQEDLYRAFNSCAKPHHSTYPSDRYLVRGKQIPPTMFTVRGDRSIPPTRPGFTISPKAEPTFNYHTIRFIPRSHAKRLLQMHHYFEQVLDLTIGYYAKIALLVALSSRGDMITVRKLFAKWQARQPKDKRGDGRIDKSHSEAEGKEMYSAVIRGLVGRNFQDHEQRPFYIKTDHTTGTKNNGITQMYTALELFYDLLRRGGTPTFETYHSLVLGLAVFKNNMEAAELLLDHMLLKKRKPYVQVLHVMCREYVRRKDFARAERIFGMLQEYGIRPRALTCNLMLGAVFRMPTMEALQYLGQVNNNHSILNATTTTTTTTTTQGSEDLEVMAHQLKRQKIREIREYMRINNTAPDQETFSILMYGYGHMEDGYPDLKETMMEMSTEQSQIEPNLILLNSLLFAHLNHGKVKIAESILNQILSTPHPAKDRAAAAAAAAAPGDKQETSPFRKSRQVLTEEDEKDENKGDDGKDEDGHVRYKEKRPRRTIHDKIMMIPGKGTFHALMLAHVGRGDILGMERILDKMIQAQKQQQDQQDVLLSRARSQSLPRALRRPLPSMINLEADEYTANIMLLGYLTQRNFDKVNVIRKQIQARPDWKSSFMFQDREDSRQQMIEFVRQQSSKTIVEQFLQQQQYQSSDDDDPSTHSNSNSDDDASSTSRSPESDASLSLRKAPAFDPTSENGEEELEDDIEIDVTTLSAKLRGLMKSSATTSTSSSSTPSTSTHSSSSSSSPSSTSSPSSPPSSEHE